MQEYTQTMLDRATEVFSEIVKNTDSSDIKFRDDGRIWFMGGKTVYSRTFEEHDSYLTFDLLKKAIFQNCPNQNRYARWESEKINSFDDGITIGETRVRLALSRSLGREEFTIRILPRFIPAPDDLLIPKSIVDRNREVRDGITLVVGTTGHGKSTTIASLTQDRARNQASGAGVTTFEDPIEFIYEELPNVWFSQYQLEVDFSDYISGIAGITTRNRTTDIVVQEIRRMGEGRSMIPTIVDASQAGRYVSCSHHAEDVERCIGRLYNELAETGNLASWDGLAKQIRMIIAQRLEYSNIIGKLVAVHEVLHSSPKGDDNTWKLIADRNYDQIKARMRTERAIGNMTFELSREQRIKDRLLEGGFKRS